MMNEKRTGGGLPYIGDPIHPRPLLTAPPPPAMTVMPPLAPVGMGCKDQSSASGHDFRGLKFDTTGSALSLYCKRCAKIVNTSVDEANQE